MGNGDDFACGCVQSRNYCRRWSYDVSQIRGKRRRPVDSAASQGDQTVKREPARTPERTAAPTVRRTSRLKITSCAKLAFVRRGAGFDGRLPRFPNRAFRYIGKTPALSLSAYPKNGSGPLRTKRSQATRGRVRADRIQNRGAVGSSRLRSGKSARILGPVGAPFLFL
jgi:hypothetical protein